MTTTAEHPRQIWDAALGQLQLHVTRPNFETWLKNTVGVAYRDGEFVVGAPNAFVAEMLEQRMYSLISRTLESVVKSEVEIRFEVTTPEGEPPALHSVDGGNDEAGGAPVVQVEAQPPVYRPASLNPRYVFERFVVGKSNELAHAAATAVSGRPGELYNPLVLYSDVGLGKTHLMHAIGHRATSQGMSLIYSTTEEFTNSYIRAIREGTTDEFRERYRSADLLLLDDVQFLIGKEQTQEGFFHTFNALHMTNRQIVLTSDRPVSALTLLEDRIQSRLAGGLVVDIQPPDVETRIAILRAKAEEMRQEVPDAVLQFLAERIHKNIRELEGSLNKVVALADLTGSPVTIDLTKQAVADVVETAAERHIPDAAVIETVSSHFGVPVEAIKGRKRDKKTAQARQIAMYLLREESQLDLTVIGKMLGGKNHTTVSRGYDRIANQLNVDPQLRRHLINIREALSSY